MAFFQILLHLSFLASITPASAVTTFQPNCTTPDHPFNIVSSSRVRSTYDILWSSLFTLLVCTWTIQHLNIPRQTPDCTTWRQSSKEYVRAFWSKLKWMILTLIMPEFLVGKALQDFIRARKSYHDMKKFAVKDGVSWTMTHCFYADMGGFLYEYTNKTNQNKSNISAQPTETPPVELRNGSADKSDKVYVCIDLDSMVYLRQTEDIQRLPDVSEKEILDKSKGDIFVKGLAIIQVVWLIVQVVSRAAKNLPISQLEIAILGYCSCAMVTYTLLWYKPQNVGTPTYTNKCLSNRPISHIYSWFRRHLALGNRYESNSTIPNDVYYRRRTNSRVKATMSVMNYGLAAGGTIFGALHCVAWRFQFPSQTDAMLWRISAVICTAGLPAFYTGCYIFFASDESAWYACCSDLLMLALTWSSAIAYVFARICLIVLVFRSLFYLPTEAFLSTWSSEVPHF